MSTNELIELQINGRPIQARPGQTIYEVVTEQGVTVLGPTNLPSTIPFHASQMYARNLMAFFKGLIKDRQVSIDLNDEVMRDTLLTKDGEVVQPKVRELLGLPVEGRESTGAPTG